MIEIKTLMHFRDGGYLTSEKLRSMGIWACYACGELNAAEDSECHRCGDEKFSVTWDDNYNKPPIENFDPEQDALKRSLKQK